MDRWWVAYASAAAVAALTYALLPAGAARDVLFLCLAAPVVAVILVGVRRNRPVRPAPWYLMAAGTVLLVAGDAIFSYHVRVLEQEPFPSAADVAYLAAYPVLAAAFMLLVRGRQPGRDRESLIDSSIFTISLGLLTWVLVVRPTAADSELTALERGVALAYPLMDVLLVGLLVRLLTGPGARTASFWMLAASGALLLAADLGFQVSELHGAEVFRWTEVLFALSYLVLGAAALHPSMRLLSEPAPETAVVFTRRRLLALTAASMVAPGVLGVQLALGGTLDAWAVVVSSVALFGLVVLRMNGLLTRVQEQAGALAAMARTDALTGLPNRRTADAELERMRERAQEEGRPLVVAMIDLDRFKSFNDTFGHQAGDKLLRGAAAAWRSGLKGSGIVLSRYGGEEFQAVAVGRTLGDVERALQGLRGTTPAGQTFSAGVAAWDGTESLAALVRRADVALYAAKREGRDRVVAAATPRVRVVA
ncbi:diguanylate cyclase (GGDEF)-like protein [Kineococcus xinjiangensis]|uniref:Diguanylate cyclase (GGDEF)-like protein n=1 Tax=Kineococcus xinjiangensis TaxID=512762 RepID=A0A2S6IGP7_9ACTN|nr:GGDEF domain-containing protein [Kineococcus xinjiangensis]PPK93394.1 diguanylate cyclase (GGDEF)-like protein [Kineococcus xinjiangensis]